ncbi:unnamed protein product, partial [Rotaria sordida]
QRCFSESDQCSSMSAIPVCVDKNPEVDSIVIPSTINNKPAVISVNVSIDYSCGNDSDYHLINDYCYKVLFHETTWNEAKVLKTSLSRTRTNISTTITHVCDLCL